ncbi:trimeric LpxA-like protein [Aspergillus falconensis]
MLTNINEEENLVRMERGKLYYAFIPRLSYAGLTPSHHLLSFLITATLKDLEESDDTLLNVYPWIERPIAIDYGYNVKVGKDVFINFNCVILDTCKVTTGSRTLIGPNTQGPEHDGPISIGCDCWIAGNVVILSGVSIGDGCTVGAGSVDIPADHVTAENPARILRKIEPRGSGSNGEVGKGTDSDGETSKVET